MRNVSHRYPRCVTRDERGFGLVEILMAMVILSVGLLALTSISASVASQTRISAERTAQAMAAQQVLEDYTRRGYANAASGVDTVYLSGQSYIVTSTVTDVGARVRQVQAVVSGRGSSAARTYVTRIYDPISLP
jgi:uncharacterized protein (TIGR02598 family)